MFLNYIAHKYLCSIANKSKIMCEKDKIFNKTVRYYALK